MFYWPLPVQNLWELAGKALFWSSAVLLVLLLKDFLVHSLALLESGIHGDVDIRKLFSSSFSPFLHFFLLEKLLSPSIFLHHGRKFCEMACVCWGGVLCASAGILSQVPEKVGREFLQLPALVYCAGGPSFWVYGGTSTMWLYHLISVLMTSMNMTSSSCTEPLAKKKKCDIILLNDTICLLPPISQLQRLWLCPYNL